MTDPNGKVIGRHNGLDSVTIGQRHGFRVDVGGGPWYAAAKDAASNCLVAVPGREHELLYARAAMIRDLHWIADPPSKGRFSVAVRYRQDAVPAIVTLKKRSADIVFSSPVFAVAPGQSAVVYRGRECLGGGRIVSARH